MAESMTTPRECDVAVIGGGLVGSAVAWGLAKAGQRVTLLDEGDIALRASRGNFALVWVQSKGMGLAPYSTWTQRSADAWGGFADELGRQTGLDVCHQRPGGFHVVLSAEELRRRADFMELLQAQPGMQRYPYEMLDRGQLAKMLPGIGPEVAGASYCPLDGHVNALRLLRALNAGMQQLGVRYLSDHGVQRIAHRGGGGFAIHTSGAVAREVQAAKVVLAAGVGNARLGPMVGLSVPVRPQRGQVIVTERTAPFLHYPTASVRQTDEGSVMIGDSHEEATEAIVGRPVLSVMADRAVRIFPQIGRLNVVRSWAALRVMTQDGFPIYDQSASCPGAFVVTCHSGVTLAASHALVLAPLIAQGELPADPFEVFSARRFDVPAAA